ncbi:hypothetical protein OPT719_51 [Escherichia phage vB_EcoD_Opt-719]|nr:hypothetical protein OPT719_51 [Escherichia phage vB_EcoD_Opt-719]
MRSLMQSLQHLEKNEMTKLFCVINKSKTLPFTVNNPYSAEYQGEGNYKIYGDDMTWIFAPIDGALLEFIIAD